MSTTRRILAAAALGLTLAACGNTATPDSVAAEFAAAYAGGDTPKACTLAAGRALELMTSSGLCEQSQWDAQGFWATDQCTYPAATAQALGERYIYLYATNGRVAGGEAFAVGVGGSPELWRVTLAVAGDKNTVARLCSAQVTG